MCVDRFGRFVFGGLVLGTLAFGLLLAAPPQLVRYQATLTDDAGVPLSGSHDVDFAIYDAASGGTVLWSENRPPLVLQDGVLDVMLGEVAPLASSTFNLADRWLEVAVDGAVLLPRQKLATVPFAFVTDRLGAKTLSEVEAEIDTRIATHSAQPDPHSAYVKRTGDTVSGMLSLSGPLSGIEIQSAMDTPFRVTSSDLDANFIFEGAGSSRILASSDSPDQTLGLLATDTGETSASVVITGNDIDLIGTGTGSLLLATAGQSTTGDIVLTTQNTQRMIVTQDGNVGIGTTSPTVQLHVKNAADDGSWLTLEGHRSAAGGWASGIDLLAPESPSAADRKHFRIINFNGVPGGQNTLQFRSINDNFTSDVAFPLTLNHDGFVGIGTTAPTGLVHVSSGAVTTDLRITNTFAPVEGVVLAGMSGGIDRMVAGTLTPHDLAFTAGNATRMTIQASGNVGIGTTSSGSKLDIVSGSDDILRVFRSNSGLILGASASAMESYVRLLTEDGQLAFQSSPSTNGPWAETMRIESTTRPLQLGSYASGVGIETNGGSPHAGALRFGDSSGWKFYIGRAQNSVGGPLNTGATGALLTVADNGNVGIGTSSPARVFQVVQNSLTNPVADAWETYSSRRWKTNIETIPNALDLVKELRGVSFDWLADSKHDIGMIAEEVGAVIPEIVTYEESTEEAVSLDYARLVAVLVQAVKEQQIEIERQQARLGELERLAVELIESAKTR